MGSGCLATEILGILETIGPLLASAVVEASSQGNDTIDLTDSLADDDAVLESVLSQAVGKKGASDSVGPVTPLSKANGERKKAAGAVPPKGTKRKLAVDVDDPVNNDEPSNSDGAHGAGPSGSGGTGSIREDGGGPQQA
eukprot:jgi/Mesvir1/21388/Mv20869-RA.1